MFLKGKSLLLFLSSQRLIRPCSVAKKWKSREGFMEVLFIACLSHRSQSNGEENEAVQWDLGGI